MEAVSSAPSILGGFRRQDPCQALVSEMQDIRNARRLSEEG